MPYGTAALIVAAGSGSRAGGSVPKQYQALAGKPILSWSLDTFVAHRGIDRIYPIIAADDAARYAALAHRHAKLQPPIHGAETRQDSVRAGLDALTADPPRRVLI